MRTVIFLGLLGIAGAIRSDWCTGSDISNSRITFFACVLGIAIIMDIVDFLKSHI